MSLVVYKHTNKINGKVYIGQTKDCLNRWKPSSYVGSTYFYHAIQKYGWNNFQHEFLKTNLTQEEADYWERYFIKKYQSTNPQYGYNICEGGGHKIILHGEKNGFYGKQHTPESIKIMKQKKYGGNNPGAKAVRCITTGEIFPSCREASDWCGIARQNINRCAKGGRPTAGKHPITKEKLEWRYIEDEISINEGL